MENNIFDRLGVILNFIAQNKVRKDLQKEFKKYNISLTSKGELVIQDEFGMIIRKEELQSDFNFKVQLEESKMLNNILKKLGYPIEE